MTGSFEIGKLRVQAGTKSLRATFTSLSQKGNIAHNHHVVTTVNQSVLVGPVRTDARPKPLPEGSHPLEGARWVYHDHTGYIFSKAEHIEVLNESRTGRWSDIGAGSDKPVTKPVFCLWLDHGAGCTNANYDYVVLPAATLEQTRERAENPGLKVLSNTPRLQAVHSRSLGLTEVAFWEAGSLETPRGEITVDQPCLLLVRPRNGGGVQATVSNPKNTPLTVAAQVGKRKANIVLPDGPTAGSSVTQKLN